MKILVTGALGYVGPAVITQLHRVFPQAHVSGLDSGLFVSSLIPGLRAPESCLSRVTFRDVRDVTEADLDGFDAVIHLAAVSNDPMGDRFAAVTRDINALSSLRLAELAKQAGVGHFVFASSASVYGLGGDLPRNEDSPVAPLTAYAKSKLETEQGLAPLAGAGFTVTCLRFATACGWSPRLRLDLVLNDFVASAATTGSITVLSDGSPWRPLIHINDMGRAAAWALTPERAAQGPMLVVNVGSSGWNFQIRDLAQAVARVLGGVTVSINTDAQPDKRSYRLDFSRWETIAPGAQPQETLDGAIAELSSRMRSIPGLDGDFRSSWLIRLAELERLKSNGLLGDDLRWVS